MSGTHWLWLEKCHLFWIFAALSYSQFSGCFSLAPCHFIWNVRRAPPNLSPMLGLACGTENQGVGVGLGLLVLVNVISAVTHKVFVFHHAAVSAHPLCQPASLSPGIIYPRSTEHMGHTLSCLSVAPLPASANQVARCSELCDAMCCLHQSGWTVFFDRPAALVACHLTWWGYHESGCNHGDGFSKTQGASRMYG